MILQFQKFVNASRGMPPPTLTSLLAAMVWLTWKVVQGERERKVTNEYFTLKTLISCSKKNLKLLSLIEGNKK